MWEQLQDGFTVTLMGMGVVFLLLTTLVGVVQAMSRLCRLLEGEPVSTATASTPVAVEEEIVSAIGAAITAYRQQRKR
jgi:sodium pump decarboxylase gamma subunit